jgi:hypothetical protein
MKTRLLTVILLLIFMVSCNLPSALPTPTVSPQAEMETPVPQPVTQTPLPTETLPPYSDRNAPADTHFYPVRAGRTSQGPECELSVWLWNGLDGDRSFGERSTGHAYWA